MNTTSDDWCEIHERDPCVRRAWQCVWFEWAFFVVGHGFGFQCLMFNGAYGVWTCHSSPTVFLQETSLLCGCCLGLCLFFPA